MKRATGIAGAMSLVVFLTLSACGSSSLANRTTPGTSPSATGSAPLGATPPPSGSLMVLVIRKTNANPPTSTIEIIDSRGHLNASTDFSAPGRPFMSGCVGLPPPSVRVAAGAVFFADSIGRIHRLEASGAVTQVASFPITSNQFLSFAVSPDGQKLIAILFGTPPVINPMPPFGVDPYVATGHWTLDLETAITGGATTKVLHRDFGHTYPSTGPTLIAGWDDAGPVATLNSYMCLQSSIPSVEYTNGSLIHLGSDGTHLDVIGGAGCQPWDELHDGTTICGGADWQSFTVRTRAGTQLWSGNVGRFVLEPRLSPNGDGVSVNGDAVQVYLRDSGQPASFARELAAKPYILGWVGSDYVLALKGGSLLGLVPVADMSNFIGLGLSLQTACADCDPTPVSLAGTLGVAAT